MAGALRQSARELLLALYCLVKEYATRCNAFQLFRLHLVKAVGKHGILHWNLRGFTVAFLYFGVSTFCCCYTWPFNGYVVASYSVWEQTLKAYKLADAERAFYNVQVIFASIQNFQVHELNALKLDFLQRYAVSDDFYVAPRTVNYID